MNSPTAIVTASIENELEAVTATARRLKWSTIFDKENLLLIFDGIFPKDGSPLKILANVDDYPVLPPIWSFQSKNDEENLVNTFPIGGVLETGQGSIFHPNNLVCAHFNRHAYKEYNGPHGDWGAASSWKNVNTGRYVFAKNIAQMFVIIIGHLNACTGLRYV